MANWAYVESGEVKTLHETLPIYWKNISNFFALADDIDTLRNFGWYPVIITTQDINDHNKFGYGETAYTLDLDSNTVIQNTEILPKYFDELSYFTEQRNSFMTYLRDVRNDLLSKSDWSMTVDILEKNTSEWKNAWVTYRQQLRDLPDVYESKYPEIIDVNLISFPPIPVV